MYTAFLVGTAGSGKSFYQTVQRVGRGLRKTKEKQELEVWDFIDNTNFHLKDWSQERWTIYTKEEYPINAVKLTEILKQNKDNNKEV